MADKRPELPDPHEYFMGIAMGGWHTLSHRRDRGL